ncbi:hypothetical protein GPECTOR_20g561 [Gonium pectorale]|uniref:Uncharacterized protein n=1 Tax=Gonium pectorale TaxID=33097 RepID=A0A150GIV2_GONPE|nr:hypothetical protein GPECTOR_20g561 [Gonium pectorale]|eukprot:KXZ49704.1 hypothetical protein GPECTOR_20g561 [Gonium pectorale]
MFSQDPGRIRSAVLSHFAPDAVLVHTLARAHGRGAIYRLYRAYGAAFVVRPVVREIVIDPRPRAMRKEPAGEAARGPQPPPPDSATAVVWVDQHVSLKAAPFIPAGVYATTIFLKFRPCPETGLPLVYEQYDHISRESYILSLGPVARWLQEDVVQPAGSFAAGLLADSVDWLDVLWTRLGEWLAAAIQAGSDVATGAAKLVRGSFLTGDLRGGTGAEAEAGSRDGGGGWSPDKYGSAHSSTESTSYTPSTSTTGGSPSSHSSSPGDGDRGVRSRSRARGRVSNGSGSSAAGSP